MVSARRDGSHILALVLLDGIQRNAVGEWRQMHWNPYTETVMSKPWHNNELTEHFSENELKAWPPLPRPKK
jgi:hypothetical protein